MPVRPLFATVAIRVAIGVGALSALLLSLAVFGLSRPIDVRPGQIFVIESGTGIRKLARQLSAEGVLPVPEALFEIAARLTAGQGYIQAGEYRLVRNFDVFALLAHFRSGEVVRYKVTFPEGLRFDEWVKRLRDTPGLAHTIDAGSGAAVMRLLGEPGVSPEGQFYPDTYIYVRGDEDTAVLRAAYERMRATLDTAWHARRRNLPLASPYAALILASIVEKETSRDEDRANIASVFINRLRAGMRLQSDPTVIYGLHTFDGDLLRTHLRQRTPYNTYVIAGLPPTPISNPGSDAIRAVLDPPETLFLYFVARGDGSSEFSADLAAHNRAVTRFQRSGRAKGAVPAGVQQ